MAIVIKDGRVCEKINQLKKAIEILGGKSILNGEEFSEDFLANKIINQCINGEFVGISINEIKYSYNELLNIKLEYEKYILKNKNKTIDSIIYKIKKYDTSLESLIRKYKNKRFLEDYNLIVSTIQTRYRRDLNLLILNKLEREAVEVLSKDEEDLLYGEYLTQKRKQIIDSITMKLGVY